MGFKTKNSPGAHHFAASRSLAYTTVMARRRARSSHLGDIQSTSGFWLPGGGGTELTLARRLELATLVIALDTPQAHAATLVGLTAGDHIGAFEEGARRVLRLMETARQVKVVNTWENGATLQISPKNQLGRIELGYQMNPKTEDGVTFFSYRVLKAPEKERRPVRGRHSARHPPTENLSPMAACATVNNDGFPQGMDGVGPAEILLSGEAAQSSHLDLDTPAGPRKIPLKSIRLILAAGSGGVFDGRSADGSGRFVQTLSSLQFPAELPGIEVVKLTQGDLSALRLPSDTDNRPPPRVDEFAERHIIGWL